MGCSPALVRCSVKAIDCMRQLLGLATSGIPALVAADGEEFLDSKHDIFDAHAKFGHDL